MYRVVIKQNESEQREVQFAQKLIQCDLKLLTKEQITNFFRTVFTEINVMYFISQLNCNRLIKIRGISLDINRNAISYLAIFTDLMNKDLHQFIKEVRIYE